MTTISNNVRTQPSTALQSTRAASGPNDILNRYQPSGASAATARQDGLQAGVGASQRMAQTDLRRLQPYADEFAAAGARHGVPPALLAAIASRESRGGAALDRNGRGDGGNGFGLMQVDRRYHSPAGGPHSAQHIDQAAGILRGMLDQVRQEHPNWSPEQQLRGAVAAYNSGPDNVRTIDGMDRGTTGNDYSNDVWARAQALAPHFGGAATGNAATGNAATGNRPATQFPAFNGRYTAAPSLDAVRNGTNLQIGHRGEAVGQVQDQLIEQGFLTRDQVGNDRGFFGPKTRAAVDAFQRQHGLTPPAGQEGQVGPTTLQWLQNGGRPPEPTRPQPRPAEGDNFNPTRPGEQQYTQAPAINDVASGAATLRQGMRGPAVEQLQNELVKHGYLTEQQRATGPGIYGPATRAAVTAFQQDHNLTPPPGQGGTVGRTTLEALRRPASTEGRPNGGSAANGNDVPVYRQGDPRWGGRALGTGSSISAAGCAMTATAMAISKISGQPIDPGQLDRYLDSNRGYSGNAVNWSTAAQSRGLRAESPAWSLGRIDQELAAGRPVVVGVNHTNGRSNGGANGTDHWVTITGRRSENGRTVYTANDPANGQRFEFTRDGNTLRATTASGAWRNYNTTEQLRTFRPQ